ncbi:hypothetical protein Achl_3965 (plasmid) [Pseudarthrobacter chlorophenolicus A6]|uniref:Uncharacterized protein n=1 Tax=Pseudarthrobacter chlorophenolicus (strain ATCC 700700 / DSM 12829 / CIP 107037 / JCM 12360 / KCTC 9906 / NCIMB 13794 / A6) TaxID=452863 RepID=B8HHL9_PSECP|nr:hypothetical protein [Pseudarthrobacter chlorophenolicus]ACL41916.1 hypothetical protein Achl_3965 [Pseudarthrobacter chlorophenolicus A6]SDQ18625.1 hypothetical protein SAMN04489738_0576 [Pseudarthrobacter chlorophenolicus]
MTLPDRQPQGIPSGGQFASNTHAEPDVTLPRSANRFADIDDVRDLDAAASAALNPLLLPDATDHDAENAEQVRDEWMTRREQIFAVKRRTESDAYAERLEIQADELLERAARANLRNIADRLLEEYPTAATLTLSRDYDDGNLAIYVESVRDSEGADLRNHDDVRDAAQELVIEYSSRQLNRFVDDGPVNLAEAAAWHRNTSR